MANEQAGKDHETEISVPEGGLSRAAHSDMADPTRREDRAFPADENTSGEGSPDQARDEAQSRAPLDEIDPAAG